jgi:hypothetical protein
VHLALHVARLTITAMAQESRELADRLSRLLVGDAVNHHDGDAIRVDSPGRYGCPSRSEILRRGERAAQLSV